MDDGRIHIKILPFIFGIMWKIGADPLIAGKRFALIYILCVVYLRENGYRMKSQ
jgi:hypothetical protein